MARKANPHRAKGRLSNTGQAKKNKGKMVAGEIIARDKRKSAKKKSG